MKPFLGKHQYIYIALAIISMCFAGASLVFAQDNSGVQPARALQAQTIHTDLKPSDATTTRVTSLRPADVSAALEARKADRDARITDRRADIEAKRVEIAERRAAHRATLSDRVQSRIENLASNIANRLQNAIDRLQGIASRLASRMDTLTDRGVDTAEAAGLLRQANAALDDAEAALANINIDVEYVITSDQPRTDWVNAKAQFRAVHAYIKEAHSLLRQTVAALKDAVAEAGLGRGVSDAVRNDGSSTSTSTATSTDETE